LLGGSGQKKPKHPPVMQIGIGDQSWKSNTVIRPAKRPGDKIEY